MNLKFLWHDSRVHVGFTLFLVWLLSIWNFRSGPNLVLIILYPLLAIITIALTDLALTWVRSRKFYLPTAAVVTGFLIGLILPPTEPVFVLVTASLVASFSKQFIALGPRRHIFNPAAFGIIGVYFFFQAPIAWWGVAWGLLPLLIMVPLMARILLRLKRIFLPVGFLLVYFVYILLTSSVESATRVVIDPTVLLFALVMLPEPITSPIRGHFKYSFGAIVAIFAILISSFTNFTEIFLPALLLVNLGSFLFLKFKKAS